MSTSVTWPGGGTGASATAYTIPAAGELNWSSLSTFLVALGQGAQSTVFQLFANRKATSTPVTVAVTDACVGSKLSVAGPVTMNLPAGANKQIFFLFDDTGDAGTNNITINPNGGDTIAGSASLVLTHNREAVGLCYNSGDTDWKIVYRCAPLGSIAIGDLPTVTIAKGGTNSTSALNNNRVMQSSGGAIVEASAITANRALVSDANGIPVASATSKTQVEYLQSAGGTTGTSSTNIVFSTSPSLTTPALGTPTAGVLTSCTGLPISTGVSGLGTGVATWLATPSEVNLKTALTGFATAGSDADTVLTVSSTRVQYVVPTANRVYTLPTTSVLAGDRFTIVNNAAVNSTDLQIAIKSSGANLVRTVWAQTSATVVALQNTPTTAAHWACETYGASSWTPYTPTNSWTTNVSANTGYYRRNGENLECVVKLSFSGAPDAGNFTTTLPGSFAIDTGVTFADAWDNVGWASFNDGGAQYYFYGIFYNTSTTVYILGYNINNNYLTPATYNKTTPVSVENGDYLQMKFSVPISGWTSTKG